LRNPDETREPRVFVSHAWADGVAAKRFVDDVERHGPELFLDSLDIPAGANVVSVINNELEESDYFVLLWSFAAKDREWVRLEWCSALATEVRRQRAFLFIVRLDDTELPALLAQHRYLDAFDDWDAAVTELVAAWRRDRAFGVPVLPAPEPLEVVEDSRSVVVLHVYNEALKVVHLVTAPESCPARDLMARVRVMLALPDSVSALGGRVGMRFSYRLMLAGEPMPDNETLAALDVSRYAVVNLEIWKEDFGPDGTSGPPVVYRDGDTSGLRTPMVEKLINDAFGHLMPRRR
jgi:hypothetical protein